MITISEPANWQDLQIKVSEILNECGFVTTIEKTVPTARGKVQLDVYAEEEIKGRKYSIVCECKYWKSDIPQTVVHGFRTIINDLGCNAGYIITTSDYQKGAIQTAEFTNIELLTWSEFQQKFFESWYEEFFIRKISSELDPLMTYTEPILPKWFIIMTPEDKSKYFSLKNEYDVLGHLLMGLFSVYSRVMIRGEIPKLPLINMIKDPSQILNKIPADILNENGYREFLNKIIELGKVAIARFRELRDKYMDQAPSLYE